RDDRRRLERRIRRAARSIGDRSRRLGAWRGPNAGVRYGRRRDADRRRQSRSPRVRRADERSAARRYARDRGTVELARGAATGPRAPGVRRGAAVTMLLMDPVAAPSLHVIAVLDDARTIELVDRTMKTGTDELSVATDLAEGLARIASEAPD